MPSQIGKPEYSEVGILAAIQNAVSVMGGEQINQKINDMSIPDKRQLVEYITDCALSAYLSNHDRNRDVFELVQQYFKYYSEEGLDENLNSLSTEHLAAHIILSELSSLDTARALYPNRKEMQTQMKQNDNVRNREIGDQIRTDLASNDPLLKKRAILQQQLAAVVKQIQQRDAREQAQQKRQGGTSIMTQMDQK